MASLDPLHPLQSSVLEILAGLPDASADDVRRELKRQCHLTPSIATVYRLLQSLEQEQVIVRSHGRIQLNAVWISHIARFVDRARTLQKQDRTSAKTLRALNDGERLTFVEESLQDLDPIWNHTLLELARIDRERTWYMYNSHPWYSLGMRSTEQRLYEGLKNEGITSRMVYGNDSFLDRYGQKAIRVPRLKNVCASDVPLPKDGYALWLCGDTMVDCVMPEAISAYFGFFFKTVTSIEQFDPALFADVFRMRARCTLTVRRDAGEAEKLRGILQTCF